MRNTEL